jgi:hypothetical protein
MNTKNLNNTGALFAISNFKLERGIYLNADLRRAWTIARDNMAIAEGLNSNVAPDSIIGGYAKVDIARYLFMFRVITNMHEADVFDALYVAAERYQKSFK